MHCSLRNRINLISMFSSLTQVGVSKIALLREVRRLDMTPILVSFLAVIDDAESQGLLHPHADSRIFEGTVGSTGISISTIARARYAASQQTFTQRLTSFPSLLVVTKRVSISHHQSVGSRS